MPNNTKKKRVEEKTISQEVIQYVMTASDDQFAAISASKLASLFKIERCKLSRQFKKERGMTLEVFLSKQRMHKAAHMLVSRKDTTIKEIARDIGYCTCDYFIKVFRDYFGVVPGRYKEYNTPRSGSDRRSNKPDRRKKRIKSKIPKKGDMRTGPKERRYGAFDRRTERRDLSVQQVNNSGNGNGNARKKDCETCQNHHSSSVQAQLN